MPVTTPPRPKPPSTGPSTKGKTGQIASFVSNVGAASRSAGAVPDSEQPTTSRRVAAVAGATAKDGAKRVVKTATKKAVVHTATKNPYTLAVVAVVVIMLFIVLVPIIALGSGGSTPNPLALQLAHSQVATGSTADIPPVVYAAYVQAASQASTFDPNCALRPAILAGIGWKESGHGTFGGAVADSNGDIAPPIIGIPLDGTNGTAVIHDTDNGLWDTDTVWDRAVGPMQFIPSSWEIFGQDGNGDGVASPHNIFDAALAATAHLCAVSPVDMNASEEALRQAIFGYNHSTEYVDSVMQRIAYYDLALVGGAFSSDPSVLLASPNFSACAPAMGDLEAGLVDGRLIALLSAMVQTHSIYVCTFKTGHSQCVGGGSLVDNPLCTESNHWHYRGADISVVDGLAVTSSNAGAYAIVQWLTTIPVGDTLYPDDMGSPWGEFDPLPAFFTDANHKDHLHIGMCGPRWRNGALEDTCA